MRSTTLILLVVCLASALLVAEAASAHRVRKSLAKASKLAKGRQSGGGKEYTLYNLGTSFDPPCVRTAAWCALICPIINARTEDNSFGFFTATITNLKVEMATCFIATPAHFDRFMQARYQPITRGQFTVNSLNIPVRVNNVGGQPVAILGSHNTEFITNWMGIMTRDGVRMDNADNYWNRHFCSNFDVRMAAAINRNNASQVNVLTAQIGACTSLRILGQIERDANRERERGEILKASVELAGKVVPLVLHAAGAVTGGAAEAIDLGIDIIVKAATVMTELSKQAGGSSNAARDMVIAVCKAYRVPLEMSLRWSESTNQAALPRAPGGTRVATAAPAAPAAASAPSAAKPSSPRAAAA